MEKKTMRCLVSKEVADEVCLWLNPIRAKKAGYQGEDSTVVVTTAVFGNGYEMDIKCCGCRDDASWTEAVLFKDGYEVASSEPDDELLGPWVLEDRDCVFEVELIVS